MKKLICFLSLAALLFTGCERLNEMDTKLSELDSRVTTLENKLELLNKEVALISELLSDKYFIQSVVTTDNPQGYKIVLVDREGHTKEYQVYNGQDGQNGRDGETPAIGIRMDEDGYYYWTVNGSWLLVNGEKVRANGVDGKDGRDGVDGQDGENGQDGKDGVDGVDGQDGKDGVDGQDGQDGKDGLTPEFKIENGKWWVKLGDGEWEYAGEATTGVNSIIESIDTQSKEGVVIFHLTDGTSFEVPVSAGPEEKLRLVLDAAAFSSVKAGETKSAPYEVKAPAGVSYSLDSYEPDGWVVSITEPKDNKGTVSITVPAQRTTDGKVMFVLTGSEGSTFVQVIKVGVVAAGDDPGDPQDPEEPQTAEVEFTVGSAAGSLQLPTDATQVKVTSGGSWLSVSGTRVNYQENTGYDSRTGTVTYLSNNTNYTATIVQAQKDAIVLSANSVSVEAAGGNVTFVVKANVTVSASSDASWLTVSPTTKGLVDKNFTFTAQANTSTTARTAHVTFKSGDLSQVVTVTQKGKTQDPPTPQGGDFTLVTSAADLMAGDELLIVNISESKTISTTQNTNNRPATSVTISNNLIEGSSLSADVQVITLEGASGSWNLSVGNGYLSNADGSSNKLLTKQEVNSNSTWTISVASGGEATLKTQSGDRNWLRFNPNNGSPIFSCYASGQQPVAIFRRAGTPPAPVTDYDQYGCYIGGLQRTYTSGSDQMCRSYTGDALTFVLVQPSSKEQVAVSGYKTSYSVGSSFSATVKWTKNNATQLNNTYTMKVLKDEGGKVWIGDDNGKGFIIRK